MSAKSGRLRTDVTADGVAILTLNRPEKRNALDAGLVSDLLESAEATAVDPAVRVVLIRGEGPDFCAGADLAELARFADMGPVASLEDAARLGDLFIALRRHPKPVIAAVHGRALAGGCGLATACDLVVAADDAHFGYPEIHLGFVPAMVMAILRRQVPESVAFDLVLTGRRFDAKEAHQLGLVARVFPGTDFPASAISFATELASRPSEAARLSKRLLYGLDGLGFEDGIGRGAEVNAIARLTEECRAGVRRFLERARDGTPRVGASDGDPRD